MRIGTFFIIMFFCFQSLIFAAGDAIKPTVSLIFFAENEKGSADLFTFLKAAQGNLSNYKGFEYIPVEILLDKRGFSSFFSDFRKALRYISEGRMHYENMDFDSSESAFSKALVLFEKNNLFVNKKRLYLEILSYIGAISVLSNKIDMAYNYFRQIVTIDTSYKLDPDLFPPQITDVFNKVSKEVFSTSRCVVKFRVEPDNAYIFLDGELLGLSNADKTGLICGNHFYYILSAGYYPVAMSFQIAQDKIIKDVSEVLKATDDFNLLEKIQSSVKQALEADEYPLILSTLSDIDQIIIVYASGSREMPVLTGVLYDNIGKTVINIHSVKLTKPLSGSDRDIVNFMTSVYLDIGGKKIIPPVILPISSEGLHPSKNQKPAELQNIPVYQKWWFWITIVGSVALLITVPVVLINTAESYQRSPDDHIDPFIRR